MIAGTQEAAQPADLLLIKRSYLVGFFGSVGIVLLGLLVSFIINEFYPLEDTTIKLLQAFSVVPGSATLFGVQGWDIQTWRGSSPAEVLNQKLFTRFSLAGLFLPVVAFSLHSIATNESAPSIEDKMIQRWKRDIIQELSIQNAIPYNSPASVAEYELKLIHLKALKKEEFENT